MKKIAICALATVLIYGVIPVTSALAHAGDASTSKEDPAGGTAKFINLDPLTLPVIDASGVVANVSIAVALQCDEKKTDEVKNKLPLLTDAYIQSLYGSLNKDEALRGGVLQVGYVKDKLTAITNKVMGAGVVDNVLLQVVQQRQI